MNPLNAKEEKVTLELSYAQKTIGMIGGTSWESTLLYYKWINQAVRAHLGGIHSAKLLLYSMNYEPIVSLENQGKWEEVGKQLGHAAKVLQEGGADFLILCCNTLHKATPFIEDAIAIPFLHIADAAGKILSNNQKRTVGLLGTQFTMEDGFYASRLKEKFNLDVLVPQLEERIRMDTLIYQELCRGKVLPRSKAEAKRMMQDLKNAGAEAILLACTELGMLVQEEDAVIPIYDTALLHAQEAVRISLLD